MSNPRAREYGLSFGDLPTGPRNRISDVPGVTVGHWEINDHRHKTGVTVLLPCPDNPFSNKLTAACHVFNGYGKTEGLVQIEELGTLETPIALTNTLNVGLVHDAMVGYMLNRCKEDGISLTSVNPVVAECNDAGLNDIAHRAVLTEHVYGAILRASADFPEGAAGAGLGMGCHGLKGGIGSASRVLDFDGRAYTLGVMVLTNHGRLDDLMLGGKPVGDAILCQIRAKQEAPRPEPSPSGETDRGSCILLLGTDLPLDSRQLKRVIRRMGIGLARLGSYMGPQSGEIAIGFSTSRRVPMASRQAVYTVPAFDEERLEPVFRAAASAAEESVVNAMLAADTTVGFNGRVKYGLREFMDGLL